jgi:hypothetical protein
MSDATPPKPPRSVSPSKQDSARPIAIGALRRVYKARHKAGPSNLSLVSTRGGENGDEEDDENDDEEEEPRTPVAQTMSNHYTLNLPAPLLPKPDTPYVLLG